MTWAEIGKTSLPQARMLLRYYGEADGSREIVKTIVDVVNALFGKKDGGKGSQPGRGTAGRAGEKAGGVVITEIAEVMKAAGWTPPDSKTGEGIV